MSSSTDWIQKITSAWKGHRKFAEWLVNEMSPSTIVELGVDYGFSTFVFATALQEKGTGGKIYGVDLFLGDKHAGMRDTYDQVMENISKHSLTQVEIIRSDFTELSKTWTTPIDILHIDGLHTYEAVKEDFTNWSPFVKENGVILFHDVYIFHEDFGIKDFFHEVQEGHKLYFTHSAGLGILTRNEELVTKIRNEFENVLNYEDHPILEKKE